MSSIPFNCNSTGAAIVDAITSELAPLYVAFTITCGGVIDGYSSSGRVVNEIKPASIIASEITIANFGRFINKLPAIYISLFIIFINYFLKILSNFLPILLTRLSFLGASLVCSIDATILTGFPGITFCNPPVIILSPF